MVKIPRSVYVALAVALVIMAGLAWWGTMERKAYLKAAGKADVLAGQFRDYAKQAEAIKTTLAAEAVTLRAEKKAAIDRALAADALKVKAIRERDAAIAQTAALPPDSLAGNINLRIGANQSWPTAGGIFSLTRKGAENVLNRFITGEASQALYEAEATSNTNLRSALDSAERENGNLGYRLVLTEKEKALAIEAWDADRSALKHLRLSIIGRTVKTAAISFGAGALTVFAARALGVLK